jgi:hypothetical protein
MTRMTRAVGWTVTCGGGDWEHAIAVSINSSSERLRRCIAVASPCRSKARTLNQCVFLGRLSNCQVIPVQMLFVIGLFPYLIVSEYMLV